MTLLALQHQYFLQDLRLCLWIMRLNPFKPPCTVYCFYKVLRRNLLPIGPVQTNGLCVQNWENASFRMLFFIKAICWQHRWHCSFVHAEGNLQLKKYKITNKFARRFRWHLSCVCAQHAGLTLCLRRHMCAQVFAFRLKKIIFAEHSANKGNVFSAFYHTFFPFIA